jgi:ABC-type Fe3+/spermidine/putrescine transport system ATPase subunit
MQGASRSERRRSAEAIAASFEIGPLLDRSPYSLSGGEQQRVALARALAARPGIVLLDEPLSSLDASLRRRLRVEIAKRLKEAGVTAVLVTHDAEEALAVADRIFLMRAGSVNAEGRPEDLYVSPPTAWIASFLGRGPVLEILSLSGDECNPVATTSIGAFRCAPRRGSESRKSPISLFFPASAPRIVSGHRLHPGDSDAGIERNLIRGRIASIFFAGHCRRLTLSCPVVEGSGRGGELELELELNSSLKPSIGEFLELEIAPNSCVILRDSTT